MVLVEARRCCGSNFLFSSSLLSFILRSAHSYGLAEKTKHNYDESKIKTLSSLEHIRLRTGMYIGRIGDGNHYDDGCYICFQTLPNGRRLW